MTWDVATIVALAPWALALLLLAAILRTIGNCLELIRDHIARLDRRIDAIEQDREEILR